MGSEIGPLEVVRVELHRLGVAGKRRGIELVGVVDPPEPSPGVGRLAVALEVAFDGVDQDPDRSLHAARFDGGYGGFRGLFGAPGQGECR